jgi:IclR family transcriptional regulator, mhp operon transcriptional activator
MGQEERLGKSGKRSYANVVAVDRVLAVLETVNRMPVITVQRISAECGIPAPTVVRILETLCSRGYLVHLSRRGGYSLTSRVQALSAGYQGPPWIVEMLGRYADELTKQHLWPFSIATLERDAMVVQYSSIPLSPLAHVRTTLHRKLPLVGRAHGIAYLAFCSSAERYHLARMMMSSDYPETEAIRSAWDWRRLIRQTRTRGYAVRPREIDPSTSSIAVPIMVAPGRVVATFGMTFFRRALRQPQVRVYAEILQKTAERAGGDLKEALGIRVIDGVPTTDRLFHAATLNSSRAGPSSTTP